MEKAEGKELTDEGDRIKIMLSFLKCSGTSKGSSGKSTGTNS